MKKTTLLVTSFLLAAGFYSAAYSQAPSIEWKKCLGGTGSDIASSIQQTTDGGYIVSGYSASINGDVKGNHAGLTLENAIADAWVVKLDATGKIQWQKCFGGTGDEGAESIQQTKDGGYILAGYSNTDRDAKDVKGNHGAEDFYIIKLDGDGNKLWQKLLGGSRKDWAYSIQQTNEGGYIVAGSTSSNNGDVKGNHGGDADFWVVKLDETGSITWQRCLGGSGDDKASSIQQTTDGGYVVAGSSTSTDGDVTGNHGSSDYWVVKLDATGNLVWQKSLGGSAEDKASCIQQTTEGGYVISGYSQSLNGDVTGNHSDADFWIVKLDATGNLTWQKSYGGSADDRASSIQQTTEGGYIVSGYSQSTDGDVTGNQWTVSAGKLCSGTCTINGTVFPTFGVPPFTVKHPWATDSVVVGFAQGCNSGSFPRLIALTIPNCKPTCDTGTYIIVPNPTIVDACGDSATGLPVREVKLSPTPSVIANPPSQTICSGNPLNITLSSCLPGATFTWSGDGFSGTRGINASPTNKGNKDTVINFYVKASSNSCTSAPFAIPITIDPIPSAAFSYVPDKGFTNVPITFKDSTYGVGGSEASWTWTFSDNPSSTSQNPVHVFEKPGVYHVCMTVKTNHGCGDSICKDINVTQPTVTTVNVITPNGDNVNDFLEFKYLEYFGNNKLEIYNRWGNLLLDKTNYANDWNASGLPSGTYFYVLTLGIGNTYKGFVQVIK